MRKGKRTEERKDAKQGEKRGTEEGKRVKKERRK